MSMVDYGKTTMSVGPWGGQGGSHWDDGVYSGIRQLVIAHGSGIDSIKIEYDDKGIPVWSEKHGGSGGPKTDKVKLEFPDEFLTSIHGYYGSINQWGSSIVRSLTFESNKRTYGPYGIAQGTYFSFPMTGGKIVGFHGKCGWYLDAIGAYLEPLVQKPNPSKALVQSHHVTNVTEKFGYSVVQGSLGNNYDVIVAFKQKNEYIHHSPNNLSRQSSSSQDSQKNGYNRHPPNNLSRTSSSSSQDSSDSDSMDKMPIVPSSIQRVPSRISKGVMTYGAWGGSGGTVFDDGVHTGVRQIDLSRNVGIVSIRVLYEQNGEAIWGSQNGGTGGFKTDKIIFDYPYEILTHITGCYGPAMKMGPTIIKSLTFHTTKTKYGPFGEERGQKFNTNLKEGKIVGFHGRKGLFIDAIGIHVVEGKVTLPIRPPPVSSTQGQVPEGKEAQTTCLPLKSSNQGKLVEPKATPTPPQPPSKPSNQGELPTSEVDKPHWSNKLGLARRGPVDKEAYKVVKEPAPCETGPWGGDGGKPWDDGVFLGIKQIYLSRKEAICFIQLEYDRNGQSLWSSKHGGDSGGTTIPIKLEYPHEVITCVSGYYGPINGDHGPKVIKSLTFTTSRRKIGPFGEELGTFFTSITTEGKAVGFHGRSSMYLDAIGVHMQHWLGNHKPSKSSSVMKIFN